MVGRWGNIRYSTNQRFYAPNVLAYQVDYERKTAVLLDELDFVLSFLQI
jgi:hypothetical protein